MFIRPGEAFHTPDLPSDPRQLRASALAIERGLTTATVEDATFEARRLLGGEAHYGVVATPLLRQLQHFGLVRRPAVENTVWDLAAQYHKLSMDALALRSHFQSCAGLPQISLPPVALRAIQRSKTFEGIIPEVLQLRREFAPLRNHLRDIEDRLREGRLTPSQAVELESAWRLKWQRVADNMGPSTNRMALARTSLPLLKDGLKIVKSIVSQDAMDSSPPRSAGSALASKRWAPCSCGRFIVRCPTTSIPPIRSLSARWRGSSRPILCALMQTCDRLPTSKEAHGVSRWTTPCRS